MVPNGWEQKSFKDILKLDRGSSPRPIVNFMTDSDDGVNWIKIGDTKGEAAFINSTKEKITKEGAKKSREVSKGEIILSNSMSYGKPYILNIDGYIHDGWFVIRNYEQNLDKGYLIQLLGGEIVQRQYKRLAAGGVVTNISSELVYFVKVNLPPLPEQRKIATILGTWDKAISTTELLIDTSKQQKKALMQQLLTGKKRLLDDSGKPFEGEWQRKLFKEVLRLDRGSSPRPIVNFITEDSDGVNWIKIGDTKNDTSYITSTKERISLEGAKKSRKVSVGEVIVSNSMSYGKPYILKIDGYIHDGWFVLRDYQEHIDSTFLIQLLSSEFVQAQYKRLAAGGVVTNISSELVYAVKVNLPQISEQRKIAAVLSNADKEIVLFEKQLADLKQEKKALMQQLLTGKRRMKPEIKEDL